MFLFIVFADFPINLPNYIFRYITSLISNIGKNYYSIIMHLKLKFFYISNNCINYVVYKTLQGIERLNQPYNPT